MSDEVKVKGTRGRKPSVIPTALKFVAAIDAFLTGADKLPDWISHQYPVVSNGVLITGQSFISRPYFRVNDDGTQVNLVHLFKGAGAVQVEVERTISASESIAADD